MNWHIFLANTIVFIHVLYVGLVIVAVPTILVGWLLKWKWVRNFWFRLIHLIMMGIVVVETAFGVTCPLTTWETQQRIAGGQFNVQYNVDGTVKYNEYGQIMLDATDSYQGDFFGRLLQNVLFFQPEDVSPYVLNLCYYGFGALILATLLLVPPHWPWRNKAQPR